jgi:hypothetical protein
MQELHHLLVDVQLIFDYHQLKLQVNQQQNNVVPVILNLLKIEMNIFT